MKNMAITSYDTCDKIRSDPPLYRSNASSSGRSIKQHFGTSSSTASTVSKRDKKSQKKYELKSSPYLSGDTVQLLSRVTEKRFVQKKTLDVDYMSSFPLAVNIYKASSDEFKSKKRTNKKNKKSVLTLPNEPTPDVQICTVSDVNDSEYYSRTNINCKPRLKRTVAKNFRNPRNKNMDFEFSRINARYSSSSNSNLNKGSTDLKKYKGDSNTYPYRTGKQAKKYEGNKKKDGHKAHGVWEILRNMNRFQFVPSPPMSEESVLVLKKNKINNKELSRKDTRVIETCRTEEFAYISSYKVDDSLNSLSQSTSFDRITVINKTHEFGNGFEDKFFKVRFPKDNTSRLENKKKIKKRRIKKRNVKNTFCPISKGPQHMELALKHDIDLTLPIDADNNKSDRDEVSSFINVNDLQNNRCVEDTSGSSVINSEVVCTTEPDKNEISCEDASKIEITLDKLNDEKKEVPRTKQLPKLNGILRAANRYEPNTNLIKSRINEAQNKRSRLGTIIPSTRILPKPNKDERNVRRVNIRYPVIVPKKEQVNSVMVEQKIDLPQPHDFDRKICLTKVRADENIKLNNDQNEIKHESKHENETKDNLIQLNIRKYDNCHKAITLNKLGKSNEIVKNSTEPKKTVTDFSNINNLSERTKKLVSPKPNISQKLKSIDKLTHRMLDLLHKKITDNNNAKNSRICNVKIKVNDNTEKQNKPTEALKDPPMIKKCGKPIQFLNRSHNGLKYPWAKAKWASDFIENIIKKIKNGVYFSPDRSVVCRITETSMQTSPDSDEDDNKFERYFSPKITLTKKDSAKIPGFDSSLLGLEIKTLNMKQIAVKHCTTNVMIHFDVTVPTAVHEIKIAPKTSALAIPVDVTASHTKIFRCNTSILNEMLPAELCSIIPRMMKFIEPNTKSVVHPHCTEFDKTVSNLSTITELSRNEIALGDSNTGTIVNSLSPITTILKGAFSKTQIHTSPIINPSGLLINYDDICEINVLPKIRFGNVIVIMPQTIKSKETVLKHIDNKIIPVTQCVKEMPVIYEDESTTCTALELYSTKNKRLIPAFKQYDFGTFIEMIVNTHRFSFDAHKKQNCTTMKLYINVSMQNFKCVYELCKDVNTLKNTVTPTKYLENNNRSAEDNAKHQTSLHRFKILTKKCKGKSFPKLYRKCKSTTNVSSKGKCTNTPLDKIKHLDDFFDILGSNQVFSSVFDGHAGKKIMSSITEMQNFIKYINPRQALLILLLTSKNDTPNLIRYRPVLLQGIAVNRITRATELEMEIEVIERENMNKLTQCDGISYLPASIENHDQLLEELYWIAKTTASDYQRPFDEASSERLLKSLLEKRKQLNPSYLRVMARYVGLGLLKTPTKK